jgi:hypothetical protein
VSDAAADFYADPVNVELLRARSGGAYAEAMARKYSEMEEFWATFYDVHFGPRVVGAFCRVQWCCEQPMRMRPDALRQCFVCGCVFCSVRGVVAE